MYGNFIHATNDASHYTTPPTAGQRESYNERLDGADEQTVAGSFLEHCRSDSVPFHLVRRADLLTQVADGSVQLTLNVTAT